MNDDEIDKKEQERLLHNSLIYKKIYDSLIERAIPRGLIKEKRDYSMEIHHIVPKCLGGTDDKFNLVLLTVREHIISHMLLQRMYSSHSGLSFAVFKYFSQRDVSCLSSKTIEFFKKENMKNLFTEEHRQKIRESNARRVLSKESKEKIGKAKLGTHKSEESKNKMRGSKNPSSVTILDSRFNPPVVYESKKCFIDSLKISSWEANKLLSDPNSGVVRSKKYHNGFKVKDPNGKVYKSINECARAYNCNSSKIKNFIEKFPEKGFTLVTEKEYMNYINDYVQNPDKGKI